MGDRESVAISFFEADLQPLTKPLKYSMKQLDVSSAGRYSFVCCARRRDGKLALLWATFMPTSGVGTIRERRRSCPCPYLATSGRFGGDTVWCLT